MRASRMLAFLLCWLASPEAAASIAPESGSEAAARTLDSRADAVSAAAQSEESKDPAKAARLYRAAAKLWSECSHSLVESPSSRALRRTCVGRAVSAYNQAHHLEADRGESLRAASRLARDYLEDLATAYGEGVRADPDYRSIAEKKREMQEQLVALPDAAPREQGPPPAARPAPAAKPPPVASAVGDEPARGPAVDRRAHGLSAGMGVSFAVLGIATVGTIVSMISMNSIEDRVQRRFETLAPTVADDQAQQQAYQLAFAEQNGAALEKWRSAHYALIGVGMASVVSAAVCTGLLARHKKKSAQTAMVRLHGGLLRGGAFLGGSFRF